MLSVWAGSKFCRLVKSYFFTVGIEMFVTLHGKRELLDEIIETGTKQAQADTVA